jgi:hypothetical protein
MQTTNKQAKARRCFDYRTLAFKCYMMEEDDFVDLLIAKNEEKKRLVAFLEQEGSIMTGAYKDKS